MVPLCMRMGDTEQMHLGDGLVALATGAEVCRVAPTDRQLSMWDFYGTLISRFGLKARARSIVGTLGTLAASEDIL